MEWVTAPGLVLGSHPVPQPSVGGDGGKDLSRTSAGESGPSDALSAPTLFLKTEIACPHSL